MQDGVSWRQVLYSYDLLAGNAYLEKAQAGSTIELYTHRPDRMRIVPGATGWPEAYEYRIKGRTYRWEVDPISGASMILHMKHFNPLDDWYGQPPLEAAAYDVDQHNASRKWNLSLLQNGARPSGALVYRPDDGENVLPEEEFNRLKSQLEDQGARKAGKPLLLDGGLDWVQMMLSQTDMDWLGGLDKAASYIAQAFNVPEQLVGVPGQQTYNNYKEARQALYEDAVLPLAQRYAAALTEWLVQPELGERYYLSINEDEIPALAGRKEQQFERLNTTKFLTINEKREAIGYPPVEGGDVLFVGASELPLSFAAEPPSIGVSEDEPADEPEDTELSVEQAARAAYGTK
jgi:HK97 family phage portal protein